MSLEDATVIFEALQKIRESLDYAHACNRANQCILMEIVRELAASSGDSHRYLARMFELIGSRADQGAIEAAAHPMNPEFRRIVEDFFRLAGERK